ncbi:MAG: long-chain fatty acid--CoA ligase [Candidatus Eremiobacteraeota bacterium]|nr:long-chain fatty acid--CoA ligase [Candidatus Eremiobacteraeota bacterium]
MMQDAETLVALVQRCMAGPERPVLAERTGGAFVTTSNTTLMRHVDAVAMALLRRGLQGGDRVALMSPNRIDWIVANFAIQRAGGVTVPLYPTQALDHVQFIVDDSGARFFFIDSTAALRRLADGGVRLPEVLIFDDREGGGLVSLEQEGAAAAMAFAKLLAQRSRDISPNDLAVLIYTSGTTGVPKGVMLSHANIATNATTGFERVSDILLEGDPVVSVLPWAHIYEHTNLFGLFLRHALIYVCHSPDELLTDLQEVRPVAFFGVPRIFEHVLAGITAKAKAQGGLRARLVPWALRVGRNTMRATIDGGASGPLKLQYALAKRLVLSKIAPALGLDRVKFIVSGSAPLHLDIALTLAAAGITVLEGYGLTECSPVVCVNSPHRYRLGTVGFPIAGVEVKLADDGELFVRGPNVMRGYFHDAAATAAVMHDGWLATGDIASIDADGFIRIVDRKKELFKTSGGKFIAPGRVESAIMRSPFVNQVMVLGNGRPHAMALVSPNWPLVRRELGIDEAVANAEAAVLPNVRDFMAAQAVANTRDLAAYEQIRWVGLLPRDLSIEGNELSPTLKIRRRVVELRYADLIERTYAEAQLRADSRAIPA